MNSISRRDFMLQQLIPLSILTVIGCFNSSCTSKQENSENSKTDEKKDPCNDLSGLTSEEIEVRKDLEYVAKSPYPEKVCDNCAVWIVPEPNAPCGGCEIMAGPVHAKGYCSAWIAIEE